MVRLVAMTHPSKVLIQIAKTPATTISPMKTSITMADGMNLTTRFHVGP